jgi:hypothetical protein
MRKIHRNGAQMVERFNKRNEALITFLKRGKLLG